SVSICRLLIERGAQLEARDEVGRVPLYEASLRGHQTVCRLLLSLGADLEA
ncbi:hypothetical protein LY76DRAFT_470252, partial [Colletotrichum caudatum]